MLRIGSDGVPMRTAPLSSKPNCPVCDTVEFDQICRSPPDLGAPGRSATPRRKRRRGMLLESVEYTRPPTIDEALRELGANDGAAVLAGGQSLLNVLKNRVASVEVLVDISGLEELRTIERGAAGSLETGPARP